MTRYRQRQKTVNATDVGNTHPTGPQKPQKHKLNHSMTKVLGIALFFFVKKSEVKKIDASKLVTAVALAINALILIIKFF